MERKCEYRNCNKDISEMRKDAKYCSRNCKTCERKYNKREDNKIKLEREHIKDLLIKTQEQTISPEVLTLFNLIQKK
jgi:hypothetical protein